MEELQARHRKEARDLQSRVTQKKKQASKKTRKGVNEECDRLEAELKQRHQSEIASLNRGGEDADGDSGEMTAQELEKLTLQVDDDEQAVGGETPLAPRDDAATASKVDAPRKGNRQKARLARRAAEQEELARQAEEEAQSLPDLKEQERERMNDAMKKHGLYEKEIRADGHCLYSAIADQLEQLDIPLGSVPSEEPNLSSYKIVRARAADYINANADDFVPFLEEPLPEYLRKIRDTGEWGGQLELMALAKTYGTDINVLQDFGRVERIESGAVEGAGKEIWLGYYKHGFGLGEHYNSLRKNTQ